MSKISDRIDKLLESGVEDPNNILGGLADKSEQMTPQEFHEYLYSSAPYFKQMLGASLDDLPEVKALLLTEPQWGVKPESYAKLFGKDMSEEDFLRNVDKLPTDEMKYIADAHGIDFKDMMEDIRERQTAQLRKDIAEGYGEDWKEKIKNWAANLVAPQSMKAVYEGRDPSTGEVVGDLVTNASYVVPWGRSINNPLLKGVMDNAFAPAVAEATDVLVGDEDKSAIERLANIGTGTLVNFTTPRVLGHYMAKVPGGEYVANNMTQKSAKELANETKRAMSKEASLTRSALLKSGKGDVRNMTKAEYNIHKQIKPQKVLYKNGDLVVMTGAKEVATSPIMDNKMYEIAKQPGNTFNQKLSKADKETKEWFNKLPDRVKNVFTEQTLNAYGNTFGAGGGTLGDITSYTTNKVGDWLYDGDISKVRGVGSIANKLGWVESKEEKERRLRQEKLERNKQKAIENFRTRGLLMEGK